MEKRKVVTEEKYYLHQARAALLLPMAIGIELLLSIGLITGLVSGFFAGLFGLMLLLFVVSFEAWLGWNVYHYVQALMAMGERLQRQRLEAERVQRLIDHQEAATPSTWQTRPTRRQWQR